MSNRDYRDDDRYERRSRRLSEREDTNFDRMYDAREYRSSNDSYDDDYRPIRRRVSNSDYYEEPQERSFFKNAISKRRRTKDTEVEAMPSSNLRNYDSRGGVAEHFVISSPKSFEDIQKMIDALKTRQALIVDLGKIRDKSVQRIMDYLYGAVYAIDGCIEKITDSVFLLTPTGMSISVPLEYIKDRVEKNRKR